MEEVYIKDLKNTNPLKESINKILTLIGSKDIFEEEQKQVIYDYIKKNYGHLKPSDLVTAFEMAIDNKFHDITEKDLKLGYKKFSVIYLSKIMLPYMAYKRRTEAPKKPKKTNNNDWNLEQWNKYLIYPYEKYLKTKEYTIDVRLEWLYYEQLNNLGLNLSNKKITDKYKKLSEAVTGSAKAQNKRLHELRKQCASELFKAYFMECAEFGADLKLQITHKLK
jgi:hypothetical protein